MVKRAQIVIIDDDAKAVEKLKDMLGDYPDLQVVGTAGAANYGLKLINELKPALLFLDIELPDANGVALIEKILENNPDIYIVMFTVVYDEYANEAFKRNEQDYLLKPVSTKELDKVIQRYRHTCIDLNVAQQRPLIVSQAMNNDRLAVTTYTSEIRILRASEVGYFRYSARRKIWEVALSDHSFVSLKKGTSASDILGYNKNFVQSHQSYIVNMDNLMLIGQSSLVLYPPFNEDEVLVGRTFKKNLQSLFTCI